jgi:hypothetical protein
VYVTISGKFVEKFDSGKVQIDSGVAAECAVLASKCFCLSARDGTGEPDYPSAARRTKAVIYVITM